MSEGAREEIFRRIDAARAGGATVSVPRTYRGVQGQGSASLFMDRVSDYRAFVVGVALHDVAAVVGERLALRELNRVVVPEGIPDEWLALVDAEVVPDSPELSFFDLDQVDGVLSTCTVAIAETGTLVLTHGLGQGRRALTLVPDYLLVVVNERQIVVGVPDALAMLDPSSPMTWISGPSATSDIELNRVEGVHGPRTLEVLVVLEELSVADHAGGHRGVGDFVDEHEAPGDSVLAVVVDDERIGGRERGETDLVRR